MAIYSATNVWMIASAIACGNVLHVPEHLTRWTLCPSIIERTHRERNGNNLSCTLLCFLYMRYLFFYFFNCLRQALSIHRYLQPFGGGCMSTITGLCWAIMIWTAHLDGFLLWARWLLLESHPCISKPLSGTLHEPLHAFIYCL